MQCFYGVVKEVKHFGVKLLILCCSWYLFDNSDDHQGFDHLSTGCIGHEIFFLNMPWALDIEIFCKGLQPIYKGDVFLLYLQS